MQHLLTAMTRRGSHGETQVADVLAKVAAKVKRRSVVILISDGGGDVSKIGRSLSLLRSQGNEVIWFQISDPDEIDLPFRGRIAFEDLESSGAVQTIDADAIRADYTRRRIEFDAAIVSICRRYRVDHLPVRTDAPVGDVLSRYLAARRARARR